MDTVWDLTAIHPAEEVAASPHFHLPVDFKCKIQFDGLYRPDFKCRYHKYLPQTKSELDISTCTGNIC